MKFDIILSGTALKVLSTISAGIYAGGAIYVNMVESPARMTHDAASSITMWKPSFLRAKYFMSKVGLLSAFSSFGAYASLRGDSSAEAMHWLGTGCAMLTIFPITLIFIIPLNAQLLETEKCISAKGDGWIVENLNQWNKLHAIRSLLSLGAFSFMVYTLVK